MGRSRYKIYEPIHPHFIACTVLNWILLFTRVESVHVLLESLIRYWQEEMQPKLIQTEAMMMEKINYIHNNPTKRGYVDEAKHWRYSSARDYEDMNGLIEIERMWWMGSLESMGFSMYSQAGAWERGKTRYTNTLN